MTDILTRLRDAAEGSRELDYAIVRYFCPGAIIDTYIVGDEEETIFHGDELSLNKVPAPHYTTSIDAALPWENITAVGWFEVVPGEGLGEVCEAWHEDRESGLLTMGAGKTEALARRIAALKARMAKEDAA